MDALPDELLLWIFSAIDDGGALLDAVPLVCKNWRRVALDPRAWSGVRLEVQCCDHDDGDDRDREAHRLLAITSRVLLHAPAGAVLRGLAWTPHAGPGGYSPGHHQCLVERRMIASASRRSQCKVREIRMPEACFVWGGLGPVDASGLNVDYDDRRHLLHFIVNCRERLRFLGVSVQLHSQSWELVRQPDECIATDCLNRLERLQELHLDLGSVSRYEPDGGFNVTAVLPCLKRLQVGGDLLVSEPTDWEDSRHLGSLVTDLVRCAAGSLQHLSLKFMYSYDRYVPYPPTVTQALSQCESLRSLRCDNDLTDMRWVRDMASLHTLDLMVYSLHEGGAAEDVQDVGNDVLADSMDFFNRSNPLAALQELRIDCTSPINEPLLHALTAAAAESVTTLEIGEGFGTAPPGLIDQIIGSLPCLTTVSRPPSFQLDLV